MLALREAQRLFFAALLERKRSAEVLPLLRQGWGPSPAQRLQIYRNNLFEGLSDALRAVFPVLAQLVGDAFFRSLARRFIAAHPLRAAHLQGFGRELPAFLAGLPVASDWPYLADVAALEWAWHEVYHEADGAPLRPEHLARLPAARHLDLRLALVPTARLVASPYPVLRIWQEAGLTAGRPVLHLATYVDGCALAKLLALANTAAFGLSRKVASLQQALLQVVSGLRLILNNEDSHALAPCVGWVLILVALLA